MLACVASESAADGFFIVAEKEKERDRDRETWSKRKVRCLEERMRL